MKKLLALLFILLGIGMLAYTPLRELYNEFEKNELIKMYEKNQFNTVSSNDIQSSEYNEDASDFYKYFTGLQAIVDNSVEVDNIANDESSISIEDKLKDVIGLITIDKIDVKLPIKNYFNEDEVWSSVGHIPGSVNPGELGNCIIAGHRARTKGRLFNRLDELELGDLITITYDSNNLQYKVIEIKIVEPTDISVLNSNNNEHILTLITCHPVKILSHRLIVKAILIH